MFIVARDIARAEGIADDGFRLIVNCNNHGGQVVYHLHMHLLGGKPLGPMLSEANMAKKKKPARKPSAPARKAGDFYPPVKTYNTGFLRVSPVHELYYEESGNPAGKPVVFLHGGPGGGTDPKMRRFFNPKRYRIVLFDQRGSGKSRPSASLVDNTTWHLVADIEALRERTEIDRWQVFGGSWGSTLAAGLCAEASGRCTELVLRGIFPVRRFELDWFYQNDLGASARCSRIFGSST
jgi:hypothetical protein